jgi:hypothetical protein
LADRFAQAVTGTLALLLDADSEPTRAIRVPETMIAKRSSWLVWIKDIMGDHGSNALLQGEYLPCLDC